MTFIVTLLIENYFYNIFLLTTLLNPSMCGFDSSSSPPSGLGLVIF